MAKLKVSIRVKMALMVCAALALFFTASACSVYLSAVRSMEQASGEGLVKMAGLLAGAVTKVFEAQAAPKEENQPAIADISYNDSRKEWVVVFSAPKAGAEPSVRTVPISAFFAPLENFSVGRTGEAVIVDDKGYVVYQRNSKPFAIKFCSDEELQAVVQAPSNWSVMKGVYRHDKRVLAAFAGVNHPSLSNNQIKWRVFVVQDAEEVTAPAGKLIYDISVIAAILTLVFAILTFILGWAFTGPVHKLREGIAYIGRGDLDKKIEIRSGDEIESLADSINDMAEGLKKTTTSVANLSRERADHQKAEDQIRRLTGEWNNTFDAMPDMAFIADKSFTITKANRAFLEAVRMGIESVVGKKCYEVLHKTSKPWPACPFDPDKLGKGMMTEEIYETRLDRHLLVTVAPIFDSHAGFIGTIHIARDISELKEAREEFSRKTEQAKASKQFKNDLISMVTRLRSAMQSVRAEIKSALESVPPQFNEKQKRAVSQAAADIDHLTAGIDTITDIAMLESGRMELKTQVIDIREPVKKAIFAYEPKIRDKGLDLKLSIPKERLAINADPVRIEQVFGIIISNAIKFTQKGRIDISVREMQNNLECSIADTGSGIPKAGLGAIFDRISQSGPPSDYQDKGMGVGLYMAKGIIELHNGRIWAESEPEKGTRFTFLLPKHSG